MTNTNSKSESRVAIVTGASRGIGRAIAMKLASDGFILALIARNKEALEEVQAEIEGNGGQASSHVCDLGDFSLFAATIESIAEQYGRLDVLVNNAGMTRDGLLLRMSEEDFDSVIDVNLKATFIGCKTAARPMMRGRWGRMINLTSVTGLNGNAGQANYAAAKAGIVGLTKTIAKEFGSKGITANAIAPGFIETDMTAVLSEDIRNGVEASVPLRRYGQPEEIASAVSFLASEGGGYMTGQVLVVDGGLTC
ncbi:MAG: 3-oxoacyl-[acyl-carrier-protein] reductase [Phycisphaerae bacterium]|nr:3-oxoacyl-[acyl-carrier-protein] reductase [Phycisphaerae bacterium]MBT5366387.1 3-oxoacyl-[acyl-carrier-protein] reductase [Phycisphaerae bacterium]MBT6270021.1 3-oxoacyl-[acyl-carrier-protein] reductase [Phycisphaerae bacterium]MBT6281824.1 3-oxoacyl-[acyl-carrier-protein] reductase [Phycisphaerae bacterium]